VAAV
jgi:hypothetical protein